MPSGPGRRSGRGVVVEAPKSARAELARFVSPSGAQACAACFLRDPSHSVAMRAQLEKRCLKNIRAVANSSVEQSWQHLAPEGASDAGIRRPPRTLQRRAREVRMWVCETHLLRYCSHKLFRLGGNSQRHQVDRAFKLCGGTSNRGLCHGAGRTGPARRRPPIGLAGRLTVKEAPASHAAYPHPFAYPVACSGGGGRRRCQVDILKRVPPHPNVVRFIDSLEEGTWRAHAAPASSALGPGSM